LISSSVVDTSSPGGLTALRKQAVNLIPFPSAPLLHGGLRTAHLPRLPAVPRPDGSRPAAASGASPDIADGSISASTASSAGVRSRRTDSVLIRRRAPCHHMQSCVALRGNGAGEEADWGKSRRTQIYAAAEDGYGSTDFCGNDRGVVGG